jgi:hypothetical protein
MHRQEGATLTAILRLRREGVGIELRRGRFGIYVDGANVATIDNHQTVELPVDPGQHTLRIGVGRYSSQTSSFTIADGDTIDFRCHGAMVWPRYVASLAIPGLAISLRPE